MWQPVLERLVKGGNGDPAFKQKWKLDSESGELGSHPISGSSQALKVNKFLCCFGPQFPKSEMSFELNDK